GQVLAMCSYSDWACKCQAQKSIAGCFSNCPSDNARAAHEGQVTVFCNAAKRAQEEEEEKKSKSASKLPRSATKESADEIEPTQSAQQDNPGRSQALSGFRLSALIEKFPFPSGAIASMQSHHVHFIDFDAAYGDSNVSAVLQAAHEEHTPKITRAVAPDSAENVWAIIATLLRVPGESGAPRASIRLVSDNEDPQEQQSLTERQREIWVLPRRGTISPWSSKATDIFGLCGLGNVVRRV
ncbi:hypothetical protein H4R22_005451, partial [Coemansia sp. RSA 1290]